MASAQGWQRIQLAVLGFVGLCGVLRSGDAAAGPSWVDAAAGWLAVAALVLACTATYLVGRVAWPWRSGDREQTGPDPRRHLAAERTLRAGVVMTYVAVAAISLAALAGWWPSEGEGSGGRAVVEVVGARASFTRMR
jgi:drug/metabolite transporter (DMT)-like permease